MFGSTLTLTTNICKALLFNCFTNTLSHVFLQSNYEINGAKKEIPIIGRIVQV